MASGFSYEYGIDYKDTFALVAKMTSICTLIVVASACKLLLYLMDIKNIFLPSDLSDVVYMQPPPGFFST